MDPDFLRLKKNLKNDFSGLPVTRVALLGDSATQLLAQALRGYGYEVGMNLELFEAEYNQIEQQIFDESSDLYRAHPEYVLIFHSAQKLRERFYSLSAEGKSTFADRHRETVAVFCETIAARIPAKVIYCNFSEIDDGIFGSYSNKLNISFTCQLRKINCHLMEMSQNTPSLFICDLSALHNRYGERFVCDERMYVTSDMVFSMDFLPLIAKCTVDIIQALAGKFKKCLIVDLDNLLWGGVVGDDGLENIQIGALGIGKAFSEMQRWIKELKKRGIILAVCSKNEERLAQEPFEKHPDMILKLEDIAVFVANWENKVDNIRHIQSVLQIGFDSMVFLDDSPFERTMVRTHIPEIAVPELPEDPADYLSYLRLLNLFETASYTASDEQRTHHYQEEARRQVAQKSFTSENDFLASLEMVSTVQRVDRFTIPRIAQLTQRSNQFNLRTVRYTEEKIETIASSQEHVILPFALADRFGDYGLICVIIMKGKGEFLFIDTWIMSCRVLKRGMEQFVLNHMVSAARAKGFRRLSGEYLPTPKNGIVKDHYRQLGFHEENGLWILAVDAYVPLKHFIQLKE